MLNCNSGLFSPRLIIIALVFQEMNRKQLFSKHFVSEKQIHTHTHYSTNVPDPCWDGSFDADLLRANYVYGIRRETDLKTYILILLTFLPSPFCFCTIVTENTSNSFFFILILHCVRNVKCLNLSVNETARWALNQGRRRQVCPCA